MVNAVIQHPLLRCSADMLGIVVLPESVARGELAGNERLQKIVQNFLIAFAVHDASEDRYIRRTSP